MNVKHFYVKETKYATTSTTGSNKVQSKNSLVQNYSIVKNRAVKKSSH